MRAALPDDDRRAQVDDDIGGNRSRAHRHVELRLTKVAGFEWGSGFYINPVPPEDAAGFLRDA